MGTVNEYLHEQLLADLHRLLPNLPATTIFHLVAKEPEAARWLRDTALQSPDEQRRRLYFNWDSAELVSMFTWSESPQKYDLWATLSVELGEMQE